MSAGGIKPNYLARRGYMNFFNNSHVFYSSLSFSRYLFADECEKFFLLKGMEQIRSSRDFEVYAFCVMDDMIHLLLNTGSGGQEEVREILDECMTSMEGWGPQTPEERRKIFSFRRGRLFIQEVRTLEDIEEVIRYIHLLPMEYRYVMNPVDYWWSSFSCYRGTERKGPWKKLVSDERVMEALTEKDVQARTRLLQLHRKAAEAGNPLPDCLKVLPGLKEPDIA
jgi:REP element-mobilizing transposase RayT